MTDEYTPAAAVWAIVNKWEGWEWSFQKRAVEGLITVKAPNGQRFIAIMEYDEQDLA